MFTVEISSVFTISGRGTILAGRVLAGRVSIGDRAILKTARGDIPTRVEGVEVARKILDTARAGDEVGVLCRHLDASSLDGNIVGEPDSPKLEGVRLESAPARWWEFWR